ncbi:MAG: hypothetical protein LUG62_03405 [Clostridiales bacterium]|nr:hypothetical protein [Clostridiales bacterium]
MDKETVLALVGDTEDSKETISLVVDDSSMQLLTYDRDTGDFNLMFYSAGYPVIAGGSLESSKNSLKIETTHIVYEGEALDVNVSFALQEGASVQTLSGEKFDIGNASESELLELAADLQGSLIGVFY